MIRTFSRFLKPYKWQFAIAVMCILLESALEVTLPFLMNFLIANGVTEQANNTYTMNLNYILILGSVMILIALIFLDLALWVQSLVQSLAED